MRTVHFCNMGGLKFCSMKISQDIREAEAAQNDVTLAEAGIAEMGERFKAGSGAIAISLSNHRPA